MMHACIMRERPERRTANLTEEDAAYIDGLAGEDGPYASKSDAMRECIRAHQRLDELERENQRLQTRVRKLIDAREEHTELVTYVEEERRLQQRREERRDAPVWTRAKWWLFGRSTDDADA